MINLIKDIPIKGISYIKIGIDHIINVDIKIRPILKIINNEVVFCYIYFLEQKSKLIDYTPYIFSKN